MDAAAVKARRLEELEERIAAALPPQDGEDDYVDETVLRHFEIVQKAGHGNWSAVWKVVHTDSRRTYALKKMFGVTRSQKDAQRAYRELKHLEVVQNHDNIVTLFGAFLSPSKWDLYLVLEFMPSDLFAAIRANVLTERHKAYVTYQLFRALKYLHSAGIIHRDVKPSNILLKENCHATLCDFSLARSGDYTVEPKSHNNLAGSPMTDYAGTRWYRAPECLLGSKEYSSAVDMWGAGCTVGEMLTGEVMFPGTSSEHQMELILRVTGRPSKEDIASMNSPFAKVFLEHLPPVDPQALSQMFSDYSAEALDLLRLLFQVGVSHRMTADQGLSHPYVADFHCPDDEPGCLVDASNLLDDNTTFSIADYINEIEADVAERKSRMRSAEGGMHSKLGYGRSREAIIGI